MFVTGLLEEWMRNIEEGRRRRRQQDLPNNPRHYERFLAEQGQRWTPPELFEKCCPQFLAGGSQQERRKDGTYSCQGSCHKAHPTITLFFDTKEVQTIAILSHRLDPFVEYLDSRVKDGTAFCKTPFYYELKGFIRENMAIMSQQSSEGRGQHHFFGSHLVKVALGALAESDTAQRNLLEENHRNQHHTKQPTCPSKLEQVLTICRMHRLGEDLDVMSIHCMQQTSRAFRRVTSPMVTERIKSCQLEAVPLVDGYFISGYSAMRRRRPQDLDTPGQPPRKNTVAIRDEGRLVQYAKCPPILLCQNEQDLNEDSLQDGHFVPSTHSQKAVPVCFFNEQRRDEELGEFWWCCEELSYANLEREWGDIAVSEYCGQKLQVHWKRGKADVPGIHSADDNRRRTQGVASWRHPDLSIYDAKLMNHSHTPGVKTFETPGFSLKVDIKRIEDFATDDVTRLFQGSAKILECKASFKFLVSAYARSLEPLLRSQHDDTLKTRPLLEHEQAFLEEVQRASAACRAS
ncbi:MAG: hypothetical protein SGILL_001409 [Bacillariaceae sp.]